MSNIKQLKVLNIIMFCTFVVTAVAVILYKFSPIAALNGSELVYEIHENAGIAFMLMALYHIFLNFNWIKSQIFGIKPQAKKKK